MLDLVDPWLVRVGEYGALRAEVEVQAPLDARDVRVAVRAVSLNFRDSYFVRGDADVSPADGRVPFTDSCGEVVEVGPDATRFQLGDRVLTTVLPLWQTGPLDAAKWSLSPATRVQDGHFRSHLRAHEEHLVLAPRSLSDVQAATLPVAALTAWHAIAEITGIGAGSTVVVQTTGGVATFATQFAAALDARVIVVSRSAEKLARARAHGATDTIDSTQHPAWDELVLELTAGRGADLVVDMGLEDSLRKSARAAAHEATVAVVGIVQTRTNPIDIMPVMNKNLRLRGVETGSRSMSERMNRFIDERHIVPVVDSTYRAGDVDLALDRLAEAPTGKVVLTID